MPPLFPSIYHLRISCLEVSDWFQWQVLSGAGRGVLCWGFNIQDVNIHLIFCFPTLKSLLPPGQKPFMLLSPKNKALVFCPSWERGSSGSRGRNRGVCGGRVSNCSLFSAPPILEVPEPFRGSHCRSGCLYSPVGV